MACKYLSDLHMEIRSSVYDKKNLNNLLISKQEIAVLNASVSFALFASIDLYTGFSQTDDVLTGSVI